MPKGVYLHKKGRKVTWGDKISEALTGNKSTINRFKKEYSGISFDLIDKQCYTEYCNEFKKYIPNWE